MTRGFLLSLDALFALSLILLGLSFFALRASPDGPAGSALFLAGRDFLASSGSIASDLLRRGWSVSDQPAGASLISVHAESFAYPRACTGVVAFNAPCLNDSDFHIAPFRSDVWVGSG